MKTEPVVDVRDVWKSYRNGDRATPVLRGVDLRADRGEFVFLVGPSGSGKSTLLSILGCVLTPDEGTVRIAGQDVTKLRRRAQARFRKRTIGFVFQRFHLFDGLTALENVRIVFDLLGTSGRHARRESERLLNSVGLADRLHHRIGQLSMGQRQRVAVARALAGDPELILADEPTASLDADSGRNVVQLLETLCREHGKAVVVVTHDSRILDLADRVLHLDEGRVGESTPVESPPPESRESTRGEPSPPKSPESRGEPSPPESKPSKQRMLVGAEGGIER